jgi:hypothetical protein
MKFIRTVLVIAALAVFPGAARAGLIEFTWQLSGGVFPPQPQPGVTPAAGQIDFPANNGGAFGTGSYMNPYEGSLGHVTWSGYTTQAPLTPSPTIIGFTQLGVNVTLTDTMSGQSASILAYGIAVTTWTKQADGSWALESRIGGWSQSFTLGNNLYTVWIDEGWSKTGSTAPISAQIDVSAWPVPVATPEPGTLALAVCGLSLVGFRVRRLARGSTN